VASPCQRASRQQADALGPHIRCGQEMDPRLSIRATNLGSRVRPGSERPPEEASRLLAWIRWQAADPLPTT
jgi:hypothetical protein